MNKEKLLEAIRDSVVNLDLEKSKRYTQDALDAGVDPKEIALGSLSEGLDIVGKKFETSEYFLSELIAAEEVGKEITAIIRPRLGTTKTANLGKVVIGTVRGDLHEIGKNIVAIMLEVGGFQVLDLGADVSPQQFVESIKSQKPDIVAMSSLLTITMPEMKAVVDAIVAASLRGRVKVIVGGAPITEEFARSIGADGYGADAVQAAKLCKELVQKANP